MNKNKNTPKPPAGEPASVVIQKIDIRPFNRREQDIPTWRAAHRNAEARRPRRTELYDLYADVVLDPQVEAATGKVFDAVAGANWKFVDKQGKPVDAVNELIDTVGFDEMVCEIVNSKFWGYAMMEPKFWKAADGSNEMGVYIVPKQNMRPELGIIAYDTVSDSGINIREGIYLRTIMEVGNTTDLGLHLKAAAYQILKRGGIGDLAMYAQVFGEPIIDAVWDGLDEDQRLKLNTALQERGPGGAIIRPKGTELTLLAPSRSGTDSVHERAVNLYDKQISKVYLGTTETIDSSESSGYAQAKTHGEQNELRFARYIAFVRKTLNSRFVPLLSAAGFDVLGGRFIIEGENVELTQKESFEIHKGMFLPVDKGGLGLPIHKKFLYETYGIPEPQGTTDLLRQEEEPEEENLPPEGSAEGQKPKTQKPNEELSWYRRLFSFFGAAPQPEGLAKAAANTPHLEGKGEACCDPLITLSQIQNPDYAALAAQIWSKGAQPFYSELFSNTSQNLYNAFEKGVGAQNIVPLSAALDFTYNLDDPNMLAAFHTNLFRFSAIRAAWQSEQVNQLFRQSASFDQFLRAVQEQHGVKNQLWLEAEYNTAYATGQSVATYRRLMAQVDVFPYWQYRTVGDDRVRQSHRPLNGRILPAGHPLWAVIFPPNDWQCRCFVAPRLRGEVSPEKLAADEAFVRQFIATDPAWLRAAEKGWGFNRAATGIVFAPEQQYSTDPEGTLRSLSTLPLQYWGTAAEEIWLDGLTYTKITLPSAGGAGGGTISQYTLEGMRLVQSRAAVAVDDLNTYRHGIRIS